ncbi:MAG TPA: hypothetical protein VEH09_08640 [Thermodesulfobacteriota bacterium]|nr:hypothetical protein [Thermodesulfobacteriota bacterium]
MNAEKVVEMNLANQRGAAAQAIAAMIRKSSEAGQLIAKSDILRQVADRHLITSPAAYAAEESGDLLQQAVEESQDLHELSAQDGSRRYYSSNFMTPTYARILLQKQGDQVRLIAEIVRQNSEVYPRPVPLDIFTRPPFDLTRQEVLNDLERIAAEEEYRDIVSTTTSASSVFLYSTRHLEPEYASMLAEWLDVGQLNNP